MYIKLGHYFSYNGNEYTVCIQRYVALGLYIYSRPLKYTYIKERNSFRFGRRALTIANARWLTASVIADT